ncbi:ipis-1-like [Dermacentor andersoni]|uniref:ipis-1-like n=1 Tax=Dermacentor andersoni TaxID=34620 RepID=UPI0024159863|nr:leukocyte elastase inhibitor-like [Dermacentor andersoni]
MAPETAGPLLQFPIDLYRQMRLSGNQGNLVLSPWLVACILVMVHQGARGDTASKITRLLHASYRTWRKGELLERFVRWTGDLRLGPRQSSGGLRLTRYACLYHAESIELTDEYAAGMGKLGVHCHRKDFAFSAEQCRRSMDAFARAMTSYTVAAPGQALRQEDVNKQAQLVLVGLIRQEVRWWRRFDRASEGVFYEARDRTCTIAMMTQTAPFPVGDSSELGVSLAELPFESPHQSLIILLPYDVEGLASVEEKMSASKILHCLGMLKEQGDTVVTLPKFTIKCVIDLKQLLCSMGEGDVFSEGADFSGLCKVSHKDVVVSSAKQFVFFKAGCSGPVPDPDEQSTTGESTAAVSDRPPRKFTVDRPFLFLVVGRDPDIIFLIGSVKGISSNKCDVYNMN